MSEKHVVITGFGGQGIVLTGNILGKAATLLPGGLIVWDSDLVRVGQPDPSCTKFNVSATRIAEELGNKMMVNIVMLGFLSAVSDLVGVDSVRQAMLASVPLKTKETNALAFDRGREHGLDQLKSQGAGGQG